MSYLLDTNVISELRKPAQRGAPHVSMFPILAQNETPSSQRPPVFTA